MFTKNHVQLIGNIGNIETKETKGKKRVILSVATNEAWKDNDGNKQERTNWTQCVIFRPNAVSFAEKYLSTGRYVHITGSLRSEKFEHDGETKYATNLIVDEINPLDPKPEDGDDE